MYHYSYNNNKMSLYDVLDDFSSYKTTQHFDSPIHNHQSSNRKENKQTDFSSNLKAEKNNISETLEKEKKEKQELKEQNKKLIEMITTIEINYRKKINELEKKIEKMENDELVKQLLQENEELKKKLQQRERIKEVNLEREYKELIQNELIKVKGMLYEVKRLNGRKYERFIINNKVIELENVIFPKVEFNGIKSKVSTRKLTKEEIEKLRKGEKVYLKNGGSQITSLPAYDVLIEMISEEDIERFDKTKSLELKKKTESNSNSSEDEINEKEIKKEKRVKDPISKINKNLKEEELTKDLYYNCDVSVSIKDVYYGNGKCSFEFNGHSFEIPIPTTINDGDVVTYCIGTNEKGQKVNVNIKYTFDKTLFNNYMRVGNDLYATFIYSSQYKGMNTNVLLFDYESQFQKKIVPGTFTIKNYGFLDEKGNRGNYVVTFQLQ